jgi:hypothetical protein
MDRIDLIAMVSAVHTALEGVQMQDGSPEGREVKRQAIPVPSEAATRCTDPKIFSQNVYTYFGIQHDLAWAWRKLAGPLLKSYRGFAKLVNKRTPSREGLARVRIHMRVSHRGSRGQNLSS